MTEVAIPAQPQAISSVTRQLSSDESPTPPCSAGITVLASPSSQAWRITSRGNSAVRSYWAATGATCSRAKRRAVSWSAICSSLRPKCMDGSGLMNFACPAGATARSGGGVTQLAGERLGGPRHRGHHAAEQVLLAEPEGRSRDRERGHHPSAGLVDRRGRAAQPRLALLEIERE